MPFFACFLIVFVPPLGNMNLHRITKRFDASTHYDLIRFSICLTDLETQLRAGVTQRPLCFIDRSIYLPDLGLRACHAN